MSRDGQVVFGPRDTQALAAGVSPSGIARRLKDGQWKAVADGVYVLALDRRGHTSSLKFRTLLARLACDDAVETSLAELLKAARLVPTKRRHLELDFVWLPQQVALLTFKPPPRSDFKVESPAHILSGQRLLPGEYFSTK